MEVFIIIALLLMIFGMVASDGIGRDDADGNGMYFDDDPV
jgi:hypothetical protein